VAQVADCIAAQVAEPIAVQAVVYTLALEGVCILAQAVACIQAQAVGYTQVQVVECIQAQVVGHIAVPHPMMGIRGHGALALQEFLAKDGLNKIALVKLSWMKMKSLNYFGLICLPLLLAACGAGEIVKNPNADVLTVTAKNGLLTGGWNQSTLDATNKATAHCEALGQKYYFLNENRSGTPGWTPLESTITFRCGADVANIMKDVQNQCREDMKNPELDPIRGKVELFRSTSDNPPSFDITSNTSYPTAKEKPVIAKWARIREACIKKGAEISSANNPPPMNPMQKVFQDKEAEFSKQMNSQIGSLIVALYQGKLSYGEFAQKRYEMASAITNMEADYRTSVLMQDRDAQMKAQQLAIQQQQNNIMTWNNYVQSVNSRPVVVQQPTTTRLQTNCVTNRIGGVSTTNCN
jgi:hypothetical protein